MFGIDRQELIVIAIVILLFFGGKKIPELMRGIGKGVKSFKDGMNGVETTEEKKSEESNSKEESADKK